MSDRTAREILQANEKLFAERERVLSALARENPSRLPPNKRTWWDWKEIRRGEQEVHWLSEQDTRRMHKALALSPSLEVFEVILQQQSTIPLERLDPKFVKKYGLR